MLMISALNAIYFTEQNAILLNVKLLVHAALPNISTNFNSQLTHILCEVARRVYSSVEIDRMMRWSSIHFYAQIQSTLLSIINVRKHAGWAFKEVVNFEAFFSSYVDKISDLTPMSTDHFRAQPTYTPSPDSFDDLQNFEEFARRSHTRPRVISM